MKTINTEEEYREAIQEAKPTVVIFKTGWCADCHYIEPFLPDLEQCYQERLAFVQMDRDQFPDLCNELGIMGIPSFIVFRQGRELVRFVSKLRKSKQEIEKFLDRALEVSQAMTL